MRMRKEKHQVPVMVTVEVESGTLPPDSNEVAELLALACNPLRRSTWEPVSINGIDAYEDDPDSPPVPASPVPAEGEQQAWEFGLTPSVDGDVPPEEMRGFWTPRG